MEDLIIREITVYQKDSCTHTKFLLLQNGKVFGEENFALAKEWRDQGLLGKRAAALIDKIVSIQTAAETYDPELLQIEI